MILTETQELQKLEQQINSTDMSELTDENSEEFMMQGIEEEYYFTNTMEFHGHQTSETKTEINYFPTMRITQDEIKTILEEEKNIDWQKGIVPSRNNYQLFNQVIITQENHTKAYTTAVENFKHKRLKRKNKYAQRPTTIKNRDVVKHETEEFNGTGNIENNLGNGIETEIEDGKTLYHRSQINGTNSVPNHNHTDYDSLKLGTQVARKITVVPMVPIIGMGRGVINRKIISGYKPLK